jgi:hypothetical protein
MKKLLKWVFYRFIEAIRHTKHLKAVPLQVCIGPEGFRKLRFPDFVTRTQEGGMAVSPTHRPHLPPGNSPGTHFCLEAESTPGSKCDQDYVNEKFQ